MQGTIGDMRNNSVKDIQKNVSLGWKWGELGPSTSYWGKSYAYSSLEYVGTMSSWEKIVNVELEVKKLKIEILSVSEMRYKSTGEFNTSQSRVIF